MIKIWKIKKFSLLYMNITTRNSLLKQGLLVFSIYVLVYISRIFDKVIKVSLNIMSLFFSNNLGFIASGYAIKDIVKALKKVAQTIIEWENANVVTCNIAKTKAIIFSK